MFGWFLIFSVTAAAKASRSTASAPPASTRCASAQERIRLSRRRSSSLSRPAAFASSSERSELEHTSSAKSSEWCAGVCCTGFISHRRTEIPRCASCHAASQPASPAPTTVTISLIRRSPLPWSFSWRQAFSLLLSSQRLFSPFQPPFLLHTLPEPWRTAPAAWQSAPVQPRPSAF